MEEMGDWQYLNGKSSKSLVKLLYIESLGGKSYKKGCIRGPDRVGIS